MNQSPLAYEWLTEKEAAAFMRLSVSTLQKWRVRGFGPKAHRFGRARRYARQSLIEWINSQVYASTSEIKAAA